MANILQPQGTIELYPQYNLPKDRLRINYPRTDISLFHYNQYRKILSKLVRLMSILYQEPLVPK